MSDPRDAGVEAARKLLACQILNGLDADTMNWEEAVTSGAAIIAAHTETVVQGMRQAFATSSTDEENRLRVQLVEDERQIADLTARLAAAEKDIETREVVRVLLAYERNAVAVELDELRAALAAAEREPSPDRCLCGRLASEAVGDVFQDHESTCAVYLHAKVRVMAEAQGQLILQRDTLTAALAQAAQQVAGYQKLITSLWHAPFCEVFADVTAQCDCALSATLEQIAKAVTLPPPGGSQPA